jgi:predicted nucleic acid-binding protein
VRSTLWRASARAAWSANRPPRVTRAHGENGSKPPSRCRTSCRTNGARLLRHIRAGQLIFDEPGSELAVELWDRADLLVSSRLAYPEARAALAAADRAGRIDEPVHVDAVAALEDLEAQLRIIAIDEPLARQAGELAALHGLRGYDAVHLASALLLEGDDVVLATWDNALNAAARATGRLLANDAG